ncbi:uncharacterized protein [Littorina saxatilis]|uniref:uncharacterized protein n=1 Tax=Littorina saxatilis TaxID=31220 RepID=UPI0038B43FBD
MAMRAAYVFNYLKQQNVIRSGTGSDHSCSTQSEGYSPPLPPFAEGPKTRCVSDKGRQDQFVEETVLPQTTQGVHIRLQGTSRCLIGDCTIAPHTYDDSTHVSETSSPSILSDADDALPSYLL